MRLFHRIRIVPLLDPKRGYLAFTNNDHGFVCSEGKDIGSALDALRAEVERLRDENVKTREDAALFGDRFI